MIYFVCYLPCIFFSVFLAFFLTERKKEVIFLSYFQGMSDAAIARKLNLVRSTVCEHRTRSLELLKNTMEEYGYENYR